MTFLLTDSYKTINGQIMQQWVYRGTQKHRLIHTRPHGIVFQKTVIFTSAVGRKVNLTWGNIICTQVSQQYQNILTIQKLKTPCTTLSFGDDRVECRKRFNASTYNVVAVFTINMYYLGVFERLTQSRH